ncbi:MAG: DUF3017 domain-containing protein [Arcanobacterium sp.]|nr:DUF3017 domain-containing protein [Arcanobacterium sp.]MDY5589291.1 DUF3017 domain-containing protein [Arcanobacterium sp.]
MKDLPSPWFYAVLLIWLAVVMGVAYFVQPTVAVQLLALSLVVTAVVRATCGPRVVPHVRARWFDVLCLIVLAVVLAYLAPWGLTRAL